ncbi:MAG: ATP-binding protein [Elusimicrobia bacterium]|nr:ATP-binding protein [Elusimicrobiota bacterium]
MARLDSLKLTIPNDLGYLDLVLAFVRKAAEKFGFQEPALGEIELAAEEAVANVIKHAFEAAEQADFDIIAERAPLGLRLIIKDRGLPFDPSLLKDYDPKQALQKDTAGLGMHLMKKVMDEVSFVNLGCEGKELHLVKRLPQKSIEEYFPGQKLEEEAGPPAAKVIQEKIPYDVRRMRREEAIEVSRCAYKSHGYTFFDDNIYYPERLAELNASEELISVVAVTKENKFMGHAALHYPRVGARIAELTFAFVNMEYRGQGCLTRLTDQLFSMEKKYPLTGVYVNSVTNHLFTQKVVVKYGINDCGVYLAASPGSWVFKGISGASKQRLSVALSFKYLQPPHRLTLYLPQAHRPMLEKLFANIGAVHSFRVPDPEQARIAEEKAAVRTDVYASESCAEIWIERYGQDAVRQVRASLHDLCRRQLGAVYLYLDLADPAAYFLAPEFEKLGFFFSGILPETEIGDTLILQYLNNVQLDYGQVQLLTDMGKSLLDYIKAKDPNLVPS